MLTIVRSIPVLLQRVQSGTHSYHHFGRLRAAVVHGLVLGAWSFSVGLPTIVVFGGHLARLSNTDTLSLPRDFHIWVGLTTNNDVVFDEFDGVVLAVAALRGGLAQILWVQNSVLH